MAKKKEQEFQYGSSSLPSWEKKYSKKYSIERWGWNGLNRTDNIDTGQLTDMSGMVCDPPYMMPVKKGKAAIHFSAGVPIKTAGQFMTPVISATRHSGTPISISGDSPDGNVLALVWRDEDENKIVLSRYRYLPRDTVGYPHGWYCISDHPLGASAGTSADLVPRSIVMFNAVDTDSGNIVNYTYDRKQLVYPDCYSVPYSSGGSAASFNTQSNPIPHTDYATVYGSRIFGVDDDHVAASAYNSYVDYTLDTADDVSSAHAWFSMTGSNTDADGTFTAITTFDNHVVLFKRDFMQLVYGNKNPFRIVDVGKYGCANNNAWTILNGVLYFASQEKVYAFTGGTPKEISRKLEAGSLKGAVLGSFKDTVWMQTENGMYTYKDGVWSDVGLAPFNGANVQVKEFAALDYGLIALVNLNPGASAPTYGLYVLDWDNALLGVTEDSADDWEPEYGSNWWFETDIMALGRLDVRRVKKFSMLCDGMDGAEVSVYLIPDEDLSWRHNRTLQEKYRVGTLKYSDTAGLKVLRVLTRQFSGTMHRLVFKGKGYMKIYAAELKISWGGDIYVTT